MGSYMSQKASKFSIPQHGVADIAGTLPADFRLTDFGRVAEHLLSVASWELGTNDGISVNLIWFIGDKAETYVEDGLRTLAQWATPGSWIEMMGEEGERWRWVFRDGKVFRVEPTITVTWGTEGVPL